MPALTQAALLTPHGRISLQNPGGAGAEEPPRAAPRPRRPRRTLAAVHGAVEQEGSEQPRRLQQQQRPQAAPRHGRARASPPAAPRRRPAAPPPLMGQGCKLRAV